MDILIPLLQEGIDSGEFRDINPKDAAITVGAIIEGTILIWVYDQSLVDPEKNIQKGILLLLEGLKI